jgi:hypothetical protein
MLGGFGDMEERPVLSDFRSFYTRALVGRALAISITPGGEVVVMYLLAD